MDSAGRRFSFPLELLSDDQDKTALESQTPESRYLYSCTIKKKRLYMTGPEGSGLSVFAVKSTNGRTETGGGGRAIHY